MEYSIREMAKLAGVSTRTLRYYDEIGLLKPSRIEESGYRFYSGHEVDLLQQIMFYRERGLGLNQIAVILYTDGFDLKNALENHLSSLKEQQVRITRLIDTVRKTIASMEGELIMNDNEKFEAFKKELTEENEKKYGKEIRQKYGEDTVNDANSKFMQMTEQEYGHLRTLEKKIFEKLHRAVENHLDPETEAGEEIANLHREWLKMASKKYNATMHRGIADIYLSDPRFTEYYDKNGSGCAEFLNKAIKRWI